MRMFCCQKQTLICACANDLRRSRILKEVVAKADEEALEGLVAGIEQL